MKLEHGKRIAAFVLAATVSAALQAAGTASPPAKPSTASPINTSATTGATIQAIQDMPITRLKAVVSNGELLYISDSGRYVLRGTLYDTWDRKPIKTLDEVRDSIEHIRLDRLNIKVADFNPLSFGTGSERVTVFVDPKCPWCAKLMKQMKDRSDLATQYTFDIVALPMLGSDSQRIVRELGCAKDRGAALKALMDEDYSKPLAQNKECDLKPIQKAMVTAQTLGIVGVPFVIRGDGLVQRGMPADLAGWLVAKR